MNISELLKAKKELKKGTKTKVTENDGTTYEKVVRKYGTLLYQGYVVAKGVLSEDELKTARGLFWDFVEGIPGRYECREEDNKSAPKRGEPSTWGKNFPGNSENGIIANLGAGQSPYSWFVRSRKRVKDAFAAIWKTDNLLVSFDGFGAFRPWAYDKRWKTRGGWFHVDQNPYYKPGMHCVQGLVSMFPSTEYTGGLTVISGSHKEFKALKDRFPGIKHFN
ncbi:hypothetical protein AAMO2058_001478100, partial [Amorphochlora amoebiformis]